MTDPHAIQERHRRYEPDALDPRWHRDVCDADGTDWPCDTAQVLAALAAVTEERDAARADAERLFPFARHHFGCAVGRGAPHACDCGWDEAAAAHRSL